MYSQKEQKKNNRDPYQDQSACRIRLWLAGMLGILLSLLLWAQPVYAADGTLTIAVTASDVTVGNEVKVILAAQGPGNAEAVADMEFTYNSDVFSFVSCNASGYGGGEGGKVTFRGSSVTVTLKAKSAGSCSLKVTGTKGAVRQSGESLANMVAAGATIRAGAASESEPVKSGDNSLARLSLSQGELSPAFAYGTTSYTAEVPYETTSVTVSAEASHAKAQIVSIEGDQNLEVGENTIRITVRAENEAVAVYTIKVTRKEQTAAPSGDQQPGDQQTPGDQQPGDQQEPGGQQPGNQQEPGGQQSQAPSEEQAAVIAEYERQLESFREEYDELEEKYREEKSFHRKVMAVLIFVIVLLVIACVNIAVFMRGRRTGKAGEARDTGTARETKREKKARETGREKKARETRREKKAGETGDTGKAKKARKARRAKEEWLDEDEEDDMGSAIFSSNAIPAPRKEDPEVKSVDFINLDDL